MKKTRKIQISLDDLQLDTKSGGYRLHPNTTLTKQAKWRNTKVWLSDGAPIQYNTLNGKRVRINRPDDTVVDSKKEWKWYRIFLDLQEQCLISDLEAQVAFPLLKTLRYRGETLPKRRYTADFTFTTKEQVILPDAYIAIQPGMYVVVEIKSAATAKDPTYRLRRHLFLEKHIIPNQNIEFIELI